MEKDYNYYHEILIAYFQGTLTKNEIMSICDLPFKIEKLSQYSDFLADFETSFSNYDEELYFQWQDYKEYAKDTAPSVKGLLHSLNELLKNNISQEDFIQWACWHNVDCGETTSGVFENNSIEFFCLYFIPEQYKNLDSSFYEKAILSIEKSNEISYAEFIISLYLLLDKERKSLYFFLKEYINRAKNEDDLNKYLTKKFSRNLAKFEFNLSKFPYKKELDVYRDRKLNIDDFMKIMEIN